MKWNEAKDKIQSGDLIFCSHQEWKTIADIESQIVRMVTESEFSHTCVAYVKDGKPHTIEAVMPAVTVSSLEKYLDFGFYWLPTPDKPMTKDEEDYGLSKVGEAYSKLQAIAGELELLKVGCDREWECAELTICMRRLSGLNLGGHATPAAVARKAMQLGYTMNFITRDTDD